MFTNCNVAIPRHDGPKEDNENVILPNKFCVKPISDYLKIRKQAHSAVHIHSQFFKTNFWVPISTSGGGGDEL
jgi:hypothetical protein